MEAKRRIDGRGVSVGIKARDFITLSDLVKKEAFAGRLLAFGDKLSMEPTPLAGSMGQKTGPDQIKHIYSKLHS